MKWISSGGEGGAGGGAPSGPAGGDLAGTYPDPTVQDDSHAHTAATLPAATTAAAGVVELATDGEAIADRAVQGNDARLSNARTPTAHAASHYAGGSDPLAGAVGVLTQLDVDNIRVDGNTVSTTNANGNLILDPNGTGHVVVDDTAALRFSTIAGAPEILRSAANVLIRANDGTYTNTQLLTGPVLQQAGVPSAFRGIQIGNTFVVTFSNGVDFNRGISPGSESNELAFGNGTAGNGSATLKFGGGRCRGITSSAAAATTTELPTDKDWSLHKNTVSGVVSLAFNDGGVIKSVALA